MTRTSSVPLLPQQRAEATPAAARQRRGTISRADLLGALQIDPGMDWLALPTADHHGELYGGPGFVRELRVTVEPVDLDAIVLPQMSAGAAATHPAHRLPLRLPAAWVVESQTVLDDDEAASQPPVGGADVDAAALDLFAPARPNEEDATRAIEDQARQAATQLQARMRPQLREALDPLADKPWRWPVDWRRAAERVARHESMWPLPRRQVRRWPGGCVVLLDAQARSLEPLQAELDTIAMFLRHSIGGASAVPVLELSPRDPLAPTQPWWRDVPANDPADDSARATRKPLGPQRWHGHLVVVLSDLGVDGHDAARQARWGAALRQWLQSGAQLRALMPCAAPGPTNLPPALQWAPWGGGAMRRVGEGAAGGSGAMGARGSTVDDLLALLALCGDAHLPLLRGLVRLLVPRPQVSARLWQVWNHGDVERLPAGLCRLAPEKASRHHAHLRALPADLVLRAFRLRRLMRAALPQDDEHAAVLRAFALAPQIAPILKGEQRQALRYLNHELPAALQQVQGVARLRLGAAAATWLAKAPPEVCHRYAPAMQRVRTLAHAQALQHGDVLPRHPQLGAVRAPADLAQEEVVRWLLVQRGRDLLLCDEHQYNLPGVLLCALGPAPRGEWLSVVEADAARWLPLDASEVMVARGAPVASRLVMRLGNHEVTLSAVRRPRGAAGWRVEQSGISVQVDLPWMPATLPLGGEFHDVTTGHTVGFDDHGAYLDLVIAPSIEQRFRYIEPGTFQMGSSASEPGRESVEGPRHPVTLTQGYWLADTPCTQALRTAVLGKNSSQFKDQPDSPQRPVEKVSWDMVQEFLAALSKHLPAGCRPGLPTEAQWEYAARAGTATSYWWGDQADGSKANWKGEQGGTTAVKRFPPNPWGLYDVHGNVFEWCDGSNRQYEDREAVDPPDGQERDMRALRGGAWNSGAGNARSAFRYQNRRGNVWGVNGFRLVLRSASPAGGGTAASPEGEVLAGRGAAGAASGRRSDAARNTSDVGGGRGRAEAKEKGAKEP